MKHQSDLDIAIQHVMDTELRVADQRARIARLNEHGQSTHEAERLLSVLQQSLEVVKARLRTLTAAEDDNLSA